MFPSRSSSRERTDAVANGSVTGSVCSLPAAHRASPRLVPIQRVPSRSATSVWMRLPGRSFPALSRCNTWSPCITRSRLLLAKAICPPLSAARNSTTSCASPACSVLCFHEPLADSSPCDVSTQKPLPPLAVAARTSFWPAELPGGRNLSPLRRTIPSSVFTQSRPSLARASPRIAFPGRPSRVEYARICPFSSRPNPPLVPIHIAPSVASSRQQISLSGNAGKALRSKS